jgi:uncharacterized protein RhaS with RHS repeats
MNWTGLQKLGARYYDPSIGRFITQDPIGYLSGMNLYDYVGNSVTGLTDPTGLSRGEGGPPHPQPGQETSCNWKDSCPTLLWKIQELQRMIGGHERWAAEHPKDLKDHIQDMRDRRRELRKCQRIYNKNCSDWHKLPCPSPIPDPRPLVKDAWDRAKGVWNSGPAGKAVIIGGGAAAAGAIVVLAVPSAGAAAASAIGGGAVAAGAWVWQAVGAL